MEQANDNYLTTDNIFLKKSLHFSQRHYHIKIMSKRQSIHLDTTQKPLNLKVMDTKQIRYLAVFQ